MGTNALNPLHRTSQVAVPFGVAGLLSGGISSAILYFIAGPEHYPAVLGFSGFWHFLALPIVAAIVSTLFAYLLSAAPRMTPVGVAFGVLVGALSFLTVALILSFYLAGRNFLDVFVGFVLFGGLILGWLVLGAGAATGVIVARHLRRRI